MRHGYSIHPAANIGEGPILIRGYLAGIQPFIYFLHLEPQTARKEKEHT